MKNQIITGNCIEIMKTMSDKSVDLILTDPPYNAINIGPDKRTYSLGEMQLPLPVYKKFCRDWIREALRIGKTVIFTPGIANMCYYPQPTWAICWHKPSAVSFNRFGGFNAWEPIFVYGKVAKGKRLGQDYIYQITLNLSKGPEKNHPCPKPPVLMAKLIDKFSNEGELVMDPFNGSGTTTAMAKLHGRQFIGIDINPEYNKIAEMRLQQEVMDFNYA
jgi:DNA modification methylase